MRFSFVAALIALSVLAGPAHAADKLVVGKAAPGAFSFVPVDIGIETGIFKRHAIDVEKYDFGGSAVERNRHVVSLQV